MAPCPRTCPRRQCAAPSAIRPPERRAVSEAVERKLAPSRPPCAYATYSSRLLLYSSQPLHSSPCALPSCSHQPWCIASTFFWPDSGDTLSSIAFIFDLKVASSMLVSFRSSSSANFRHGPAVSRLSPCPQYHLCISTTSGGGANSCGPRGFGVGSAAARASAASAIMRTRDIARH